VTGWLEFEQLEPGMLGHLAPNGGTPPRSARSLLDEMVETGVLLYDERSESYCIAEKWSAIKFTFGAGDPLVDDVEESELEVATL
jgi:DNA-binding IclR family transcriptional regulator